MAVTAKYILSLDADQSRTWTFTHYGLKDLNENYGIISPIKGCKIKLVDSPSTDPITLYFTMRFEDRQELTFTINENNVPILDVNENIKYISAISKIFFGHIFSAEESQSLSTLKDTIDNFLYHSVLRLPPIIL